MVLALVFSCGFEENFKNTFFAEHLRATASANTTNINSIQEKYWLRTSKFILNELWHKCFPVDLEKFLRTHFLQSTTGRRLLQIRQLLLPYRKNTHWRQMALHKLLNTEGTSQKYFEKKAAVESWFCKYLQKLSRSLERFKQIKNKLLKHCYVKSLCAPR